MKGAHGLWVEGHALPLPSSIRSRQPVRARLAFVRPCLEKGRSEATWPAADHSPSPVVPHRPLNTPPPSETDEKDGKLTRSKDDGVPKHEVVGAGCARDAERRVGREPLEVPDQTTSARGGLRPPKAGSVSNPTLTSAGLESSRWSGKGRQTDHDGSSRGSGSNRTWVEGGGGGVKMWLGTKVRTRETALEMETNDNLRQKPLPSPPLLLLASPSVVQHVAQNVPLGQHSVCLEAPVAACGTPPVVVLGLLPSRRRHDPDDQGRGCHAARRDPAQDRRCESSLHLLSLYQARHDELTEDAISAALI